MKKLLPVCLLVMLLLGQTIIAQDKVYLSLAFMRVRDTQHLAYRETENFWEKIHQQLANNDTIIGWDLWSLLPGGTDQGYQYMVVTVFNDPVKMMNHLSWEQLMTAAKQAYPDMTEDEITKKIPESVKSREIGARIHMEQIARTDDDFNMDIGAVIALNFMKTEQGRGQDYVNATLGAFLPLHQARVEADRMAHWDLFRVISPRGSKACASYVTVDMFKDYDQYFNPPNPDAVTLSEEQMEKIQDVLKTRDLTWAYNGTLLKKVRKGTSVITHTVQPEVAPTVDSTLVSQQWSSDQKEVWTTVEGLWGAFSEENREKAMSFMHPSFRGWVSSDPLPRTKADETKWASYFFKTRQSQVTDLKPVAIDVHGNFAFVHYYFTVAYLDTEDKHKIEQGRWTDTYKKEGGKWLLICDHGGPTSEE